MEDKAAPFAHLLTTTTTAEIRNLDSDRKSLVYDNYSKLLSATSTIRRMRGSMDPLAPTTHTLGPAISHIAETAASLSSSMQASSSSVRSDALGISIHVQSAAHESDSSVVAEQTQEQKQKQKQRETVRWVLGAPQRLRTLNKLAQHTDAEKEWHQIRKLLDDWQGVAGVHELREECQGIMQDETETETDSE